MAGSDVVPVVGYSMAGSDVVPAVGYNMAGSDVVPLLRGGCISAMCFTPTFFYARSCADFVSMHPFCTIFMQRSSVRLLWHLPSFTRTLALFHCNLVLTFLDCTSMHLRSSMI